MRALLASIVVLSLSACTAGWNALVRYSPTPAMKGETAELGVYATILAYYSFGRTPATVVVADSADPISVAALVGGSKGIVRRHWADTLKREVSAALSDTTRAHFSEYEDLSQAAALFGVDLHRIRALEPGLDSTPIPRLWVWKAGFNADSTIAAVQVQFWCGMLCAHGSTYLLARRPGFRWRIWYEALHWLS